MSVSLAYAQALFDLSVESDNVVNYYNDIVLINDAVSDDFLKLMHQPKISKQTKIEECRIVLEGILPDVRNFVLFIVQKDRMYDFRSIMKEYIRLYNEYQNIYVAKVYSVVALSHEQIANMEKVLSVKLEKSIIVCNIVDTKLIGGLKIMVDNKVYNYSMKNKLDQLRTELLSIEL